MLAALLAIGAAAISQSFSSMLRLMAITALLGAPIGWLRVKRPVTHWSEAFWPCFLSAFIVTELGYPGLGFMFFPAAIMAAWFALVFGGAAAVLATFKRVRE